MTGTSPLVASPRAVEAALVAARLIAIIRLSDHRRVVAAAVALSGDLVDRGGLDGLAGRARRAVEVTKGSLQW